MIATTMADSAYLGWALSGLEVAGISLALLLIMRQLARLTRQVERSIMNEVDLKNALDVITATATALVDEVTAVAAATQNVAGLVAQLQNQTGPVTQDQLDALGAEAVAARDSLAASGGKLAEALKALQSVGVPVVPTPMPEVPVVPVDVPVTPVDSSTPGDTPVTPADPAVV